MPDAFLAGMARNRNFKVLTRNESEFRNTGVDIINPWTADVT
ncbi:type II toxin-antitoxin system VapC family toxin [Hyphococcus luteus]|nr:type II toxin-antitoxin system VapC family toxin [Marinicaulis flavus]